MFARCVEHVSNNPQTRHSRPAKGEIVVDEDRMREIAHLHGLWLLLEIRMHDVVALDGNRWFR